MAQNKKASIAMPTSENQSVRIEKIANGYLAHHSTDSKRGYQHKTVFHPSKPTVAVSIKATKSASKGKKG